MSLPCSFSTLLVPCTNSMIIILVCAFSYVRYLGLRACFSVLCFVFHLSVYNPYLYFHYLFSAILILYDIYLDFPLLMSQQINMEDAYGVEWPKEEKVKRREMVEEDALYIVVRLDEREHIMKDINSDVILSSKRGNLGLQEGLGSPVVAFVHYRFVVEEDFPVLYVYELQLEKRVQGKGLGKFLMQLLELIACKVFVLDPLLIHISFLLNDNSSFLLDLHKDVGFLYKYEESLHHYCTQLVQLLEVIACRGVGIV